VKHLITRVFFYGEELLAPLPTLQLGDNHLAVRDYLFNILAEKSLK
jgi:hypothetical protein